VLLGYSDTGAHGSKRAAGDKNTGILGDTVSRIWEYWVTGIQGSRGNTELGHSDIGLLG
jgi:hypothetical protein